MASSEWFYRRNGRVYGPVSLVDLRAAMAIGFITPSDLVRERLTCDWKRAIEIAMSAGLGGVVRGPVGRAAVPPSPSLKAPDEECRIQGLESEKKHGAS